MRFLWILQIIVYILYNYTVLCSSESYLKHVWKLVIRTTLTNLNVAYVPSAHANCHIQYIYIPLD